MIREYMDGAGTMFTTFLTNIGVILESVTRLNNESVYIVGDEGLG